MKKIISFVAMAVATLAMTTTVFAAGSSETVTAGKDCTVVEASTEAVAAVDTAEKVTALLNASDVITSDATLKTEVKEAKVLAVVDVEGTAGKEFTLNVSGVKKGDVVVLIHFTDAACTKSEVVKTVTGDGTVTATLNSFSPVAIVKLANATTTVAPKTADNGVATVAVVALVGLAGIAVMSKKKSVVR